MKRSDKAIKTVIQRAGDPHSIPGLGRSPGEGKDDPLQYSGLEDAMDCSVHGVAKSDTTERLSLSLFIGEPWAGVRLFFQPARFTVLLLSTRCCAGSWGRGQGVHRGGTGRKPLSVISQSNEYTNGASLVAQWLRTCLPMQGAHDNPTCHKAVSPCAKTTEAPEPRARTPRQGKPPP